MTKKRVLTAGFCVLCALLALLYATSSSPLYATNFWTDTNIYFTIGRGMTQGLMPYRDLFDHKGPVLFILYALGALISDTSYFGVFVLEIASLALMLWFGYKTAALYLRGRLALLAIPLTAAVTAACTAFTQGGCAEEFCLPALSAGLYAALARMRRDDAHPVRLHVLFGAAMGWVFAVKYTDCGLFAGLALSVLCWEWRVNGFVRAVKSGLWMLAGMGLVVVPAALCMAMGGALDETIAVYFVQNLSDYSGEPMSLAGHVYNALAYLRSQSRANPFVALSAMAGVAACALHALVGRRKGFLFEAAAAPMGAGLMLLLCYWGEMAHPYYALIFASLVPLGFAVLAPIGQRLDKAAPVLAALLAVAIVPLCRANCAAVPMLDVKRADMPQHAFAQIIRESEDQSLLDITSLDQGFYLAAGVTPTCRYFADNNLETTEKREAINGYLRNADTEFVVAVWKDPGERYELIAEQTGWFDLHNERPYKLYRRIGE